jgi:RNA polymerase sigma-70 factor (ECF subfamily)
LASNSPSATRDDFRQNFETDGLNETRLVTAAKRGRNEAFEALCLPNAGRLFQTAYRMTGNHEDAEDAIQDSMMRAFVHIKDFDGRSSFSTWLTRIAINSTLMLLRKKRNAPMLSMDGAHDPQATEFCLQVPDRAPDPEKRYLQNERETTLHNAIQALRPSIRRALVLQQLQQLSLKETAEMMDISVSAAKARLFHAKSKLRKSSSLRKFRRPENRPPIIYPRLQRIGA